MVDPASSSSSSSAQQSSDPPPTLSITVVLDDVPPDERNEVDELLGDPGGGGHGERNDGEDSSCDAAGPSSSPRGRHYSGALLRPLSEAGLTRLTQSMYDEVVDEVVLGIVFEEHRGAKLGYTALLENGGLNGNGNGDAQSDFDGADETSNSGFREADGESGHQSIQPTYPSLSMAAAAAAEVLASAAAALTKRPAECICPNCQRNMAASRFAPHLEKCMGMGRNSSRLASRRIATSATRQADLVSDDDADDDDWTAERQSGDSRGSMGAYTGGESGSGNLGAGGMGLGGNGGTGGGAGSTGSSGSHKNGRRRHKKDKNSPRRKKWKNGSDVAPTASQLVDPVVSIPATGVHHSGSSSNLSGMAEGLADVGIGGSEAVAMTERLSTMCGVVSEHTGKMCTRSLRCPQHSDSQRKGVRLALLHPSSGPLRPGDPHHATVGQLMAENNSSKEMIDVDTWDDEQGDSLASLLTAQSHDVPTPGAEASPAESTSTTASSTSSSAARRSSTNSRGGGKSSKNPKGGKRFKAE